MVIEVVLHTVAEVGFVIAIAAGISLDVLVNILVVDTQGFFVLGAEVTLITLKLIQATSLSRLGSDHLPLRAFLISLELHNLTVLSSVVVELMCGHMVSVE